MRFSQVYKNIVLDSSFENWKKMIDHYHQLNKAHLLMLHKCRILPDDVVFKIATGLKKLQNEKVKELPENVEDLVLLFEKKLGDLIGEDVAGFLHTARSRNDIDATIFRMALRNVLIQFEKELLNLIKQFIRKAGQNIDTVFLLYTHGQPAQPSSFAHYLLAFSGELTQVSKKLIETFDIVNECPMGAGAITTTGFSIDRNLVSNYLGFNRPLENSYQAISTSHWITLPGALLRNLMIDITRFIQDIMHKSSSEVGVLQFPNELVQISSIMPQKRNPVVLEHLRLRANMAANAFSNIENVFLNVPYQDVNENGDFVLREFLNAMDISNQVLILLSEMVEKVIVRTDRVREIAAQFGATSTELADELVRRFGISFRKAHLIVSEVVKTGLNFENFSNVIKEHLKEKPEMEINPEEFQHILSCEHFIEIRKVLGGPEKSSIISMINKLENPIIQHEQFIESFEKQIATSFENLNHDFNLLLL
ncbi:argininosuccinate lyase [Pseudothermotoga lettingae]|jgi:argininosuccinate lyase|uniref:Argininosuccinate lyase n=1 Tax=Pseudothermotoga lettingae (strain ATCC BAA-301 / DSM 14385 / NBRC 107922 / TMO) TaxID=416591 RepID=A8F694_PSELT|nr:argininosuccinate lyase [Pseudothermotoga lettingae]ABV33678.1 fumarate lyase [Pseudothermotoga lettingae TMO]KUK20712.1 MAG: Fumarate lyase [Pseudothermotoga lettingae]GLI49404.1 argininosuccinate lyase 2 [Pseudothermotoga lettingae TMO]HBT25336.1 argininosuccinate lyase [Pseudothermotoga sp.]